MTEDSTIDRTLAALERLTLDELRPGDALPSEATLARQLDVSRLTVREAVRTLAARGHLEVSKGRRTVVRELDGVAVGDFFRATVRRDGAALLELLEVRMALETHIAALAAERASGADLATMEAATVEMRALADDAERFNLADIAFHEALAAASGNTMLARLVQQLADVMLVSRRVSYGARRMQGRSIEMVFDAHEAIVACVRARDPEGARAAMRSHLEDTGGDLRVALEGGIDV
jgi:GntR family transcriptional repressor for pyruvate dehydrogenase complex